MRDRIAIPDIVIGGAPRSGTTFLCELLGKHPGICIARPFIPEPKVCLTRHPAGDVGLLERYAAYFAGAPPGSVRVEKTSNYLENGEARERLRRVLPEAKFVFILREPVARAYSNWLWSTANHLETLPFAEAIEREGQRPSPLPPEQAYARPFDYMTRGRYGMFAEAWIRAVGRERIAFYILEAVLAAPEAFVEHLQRFAGVDVLRWEKLKTGPINQSPLAAARLSSELAQALHQRIAPEIRRFAAATGLDVSIWGF